MGEISYLHNVLHIPIYVSCSSLKNPYCQRFLQTLEAANIPLIIHAADAEIPMREVNRAIRHESGAAIILLDGHEQLMPLQRHQLIAVAERVFHDTSLFYPTLTVILSSIEPQVIPNELAELVDPDQDPVSCAQRCLDSLNQLFAMAHQVAVEATGSEQDALAFWDLIQKIPYLPDAANERASTLIELAPALPYVYLNLFDVADNLEDDVNMVRAADEMSELCPSDSAYLAYMRMRYACKIDQQAEREQSAHTLIENGVNVFNAKMNLVGAQIWRIPSETLPDKEREALETLVQELSETDPLETFLWNAQARLDLMHGNLAKAEQILTMAIQQNPFEISSYDTLVDLYRSQGNLQAMERIERLACKYDVSWVSLYNLGHILSENGRAKETLPYFQQAAERAPQEGRIWQALGFIYNQLNRYAEAEQSLQRAIELDPQEFGAASFNLLGVITWEWCNNTTLSEQYFKRAITYDTKAIGPLYNLANLYTAEKRWEEARQMYIAALALAPENRELRLEYTNFLIQIDLPDEVRWQQQILSRSTPTDEH